jgi:hypothetical protein
MTLFLVCHVRCGECSGRSFPVCSSVCLRSDLRVGNFSAIRVFGLKVADTQFIRFHSGDAVRKNPFARDEFVQTRKSNQYIERHTNTEIQRSVTLSFSLLVVVVVVEILFVCFLDSSLCSLVGRSFQRAFG